MIHIGVLTPHVAEGPEVEFPAMAPGHLVMSVARVSDEEPAVSITSGPPSPDAARTLTMPSLLDEAAERLAASAVDVIGYASTSSAYTIGFDEEVAMIARLSRLTGIPVVATCASAIAAVRALDAERIALVSPPWFAEEDRRLGAAYFRSQGVEVVSSVSADLPGDPRLIQRAAVIEWASQNTPDDAEVVWMAGNGFRTAGAIEAVEDAIGRPVLTANQVLLWALLARVGVTFEVTGFGQLFTHEPFPEI